MRIDSIESLLDCVKAAGQMALEGQRDTRNLHRGRKGDGTVVTAIDGQVDDYLFAHIAGLFPGANILTEETARTFDPEKPYAFAVDPIDGSDVFSQGMADWCTSIGLLDEGLHPIAGIVFAPRLELLFFADVGKQATVNGLEITPPDPEPLSAQSNLLVTSRIHWRIDLRRYRGKIRSIGSAALHLCLPLVSPGVVGALEGPGAHIWDIAGAHAMHRSLGLDLELLGGGRVDYAKMVGGELAGDVILAGTKQRIDELREVLKENRTNRKEGDDELG